MSDNKLELWQIEHLKRIARCAGAEKPKTYWVPEDHLFSDAEHCIKAFPDQAAALVAHHEALDDAHEYKDAYDKLKSEFDATRIAALDQLSIVIRERDEAIHFAENNEKSHKDTSKIIKKYRSIIRGTVEALELAQCQQLEHIGAKCRLLQNEKCWRCRLIDWIRIRYAEVEP